MQGTDTAVDSDGADEAVEPARPNRQARRAKNPMHGKRRLILSIEPLRYIDVSLTKRLPWTVTAERRAANRRARAARRANR